MAVNFYIEQEMFKSNGIKVFNKNFFSLKNNRKMMKMSLTTGFEVFSPAKKQPFSQTNLSHPFLFAYNFSFILKQQKKRGVN